MPSQKAESNIITTREDNLDMVTVPATQRYAQDAGLRGRKIRSHPSLHGSGCLCFLSLLVLDGDA